MSAEKKIIDIKESIKRHVAMLRPFFPKRAVISIGNYASDLLHESPVFVDKTGEFILFIRKENQNVPRKFPGGEEINFVDIDEKADTHYWFNVQRYVSENDDIVEKLKRKPIEELNGAVLVASTGEGVGSALLPELISRFKEGNVNAVAFAVLPSNLQPADAQFNALWSMAACSQNGFTQILIDRDALESYVGVNRKGEILKGSSVFNYIMEIALSNDSFVQEFCELTKSFHLKMFTVLSATGASLKVYGSIRNVLDAALLRPLGLFDLSTASMLYVVVRVPLRLKDKFSRGKIELAVDEWFKEKTSLKAAFLSEPIYVDDGSDRLDIVMFVGGFDLANRVATLNGKAKEIIAYSAKNGFVKEKEWKELINHLVN